MNNIPKIIKEFEENFMNNGASGLLKDEFQEPKMLIIKSFFLSSLQKIRQETLAEVEKIIDNNDPQTGNQSINQRYWGITLRRDISDLLKRVGNLLNK